METFLGVFIWRGPGGETKFLFGSCPLSRGIEEPKESAKTHVPPELRQISAQLMNQVGAESAVLMLSEAMLPEYDN